MTSEQWWLSVRNNPDRLGDWLRDQFRGEDTAAERIVGFRDTFAVPGSQPWRILTVIADQERTHAEWVGTLLAARGIEPEPRVPERYWTAPLAEIRDLATGCAVGAHAERMRLERIEVIVSDPACPADIRDVFRRILPEERFHERAFRALAGEVALAATRNAHDLGRTALGLSA